MMLVKLLILIVVSLLPVYGAQPAIQEECVYYAVPTSSQVQDCPGEPCYTLEQYAKNDSLLNCKKADKNISLLLLNGIHELYHSLVIKSLSLNLYVYEVSDSPPAMVTIKLNNESNIMVTAQNVSVEQLSIVSKGSVGFHIDIRNAGNQAILLINNLTFNSSTLFVRGDLSGSVTIQHSKFVVESSIVIPPIELLSISEIYLSDVIVTSENNLPGSHSSPEQPEEYSDVLIYLPYPDSSMSLTILHSTFNRVSPTGIYVCSTIPGYDYSATAYNLSMVIYDTVVSQHYNGAILFDMNFRSPDFVNINALFTHVSIVENSLKSCDGVVNGAGVTLFSYIDPNFSFNVSEMTFYLCNVSFNSNPCNDGAIISTNSLVPNMTVSDSTFKGNSGTSVVVSNGNLIFKGYLSFSDNVAHRGGAIVLDSAYIYLVECVHIVFENNSAMEVGGAIFVEAPAVEFESKFTNRKCFYQYIAGVSSPFPCFELSFRNNKASHGGEHIYGALMQSSCIVFAPEGTNHANGKVFIVHGYDVFDRENVFQYNPNSTNSLSPLSSQALRVCLCDINDNHTLSPLPVNIHCNSMSDIFLSMDVFPGEVFHMSAALVGADFGATTGSVYAQFLEWQYSSHAPVLGSVYQYSQRVSNYTQCTLLTYAVNSSNDNEVLILTATDSTVQVYGDEKALEDDTREKDSFKLQLTTPVYINITLRPCPLGFILSNITMGCVCDYVLQENDIMCYISNGIGYVHNSGVYWINGTTDENNVTNVIVHKYCPYRYCKTKELAVDLQYPDSQCASHHAGVLCGGCEQNYSLILGSNRCLVCRDESHLGLLILFMVLGIILVFFIQFLDLTVKQGTVNGLILYANIVWAYGSIFLPNLNTSSGIQTFLTTFVAWLNLDFGIETCFFKDLNAYGKSWLQFVFPLYIWSIAGLMIKLSACSKRIAKIFGKNSVHVLATLVLLSYNKLLRTSITALDFTYLVNSATDTKYAVWSFDGNLRYCKFPHILLFIAAIAVMLLLWLPFTLVLSLVQWLRNEKISRFRVMRWIDNIKLKPFFDAYLAPLKDNHRYWIGLLLVVRGLLLVIFALTSASTPTASLVAIGLLIGLLLLHHGYNGRVYKTKALSLLENSFFCNLTVLSIVILYLGDNYRYYSVVFCCSVGVAFLQFVCIVLYHSYSRIVGMCCTKKSQSNEYSNINESDVMLDYDGRDR